MTPGQGEWLVCFAVKEEARDFVAQPTRSRALVTGMGRTNSERAVQQAILERRPAAVLTCGFAGGLNPELARGSVIFGDDSDPAIVPHLLEAGARSAKIHCSDRVLVTAGEKAALRASTGADAVEMESAHICRIARQQNIPCATVRVILDTAGEDLVLDFNALMTPDQRMDFGKMAWMLLKAPGKIGGLLRLQKDSAAAAAQLGRVLGRISALH
jgi:hypothetical protein